MYHYTSFGLNVDTPFPVPAFFKRDGGAADVTIEYGSLERVPQSQLKDRRFIRANGNEMFVYWDYIGSLLVRNGRQVIFDPLPDTEPGNGALVVAGVALSAVMHQRGYLTLHASAVEIDGGAVAFVGQKGFGKSTTAAALHARGYPLVADDVLAIAPDTQDGVVTVIPGFPQFKLWPDAIEASLGDDPESLPRLVNNAAKRARSAKANFCRDPLPLRRVYALSYLTQDDDAPPVSIEGVPPQEAFKQLTSHSYTVAFIGNDAASPAHLKGCAQIVNNVSLRRLVRKPSLDFLTEIVRCVEEDAASSADSASREPAVAQEQAV